MEVKLFKPPHGHSVVIDVQNVRAEDEKFFQENNIKISMEDVSAGGAPMFAVYADLGISYEYDDDGGDGDDTIELLELSQGRSCEETLSALRVQCEKELKKFQHH